MTRMLGIPPIADHHARRRTNVADSLVVGGIVSLIATVLGLVPLQMGLVGLALLLGGGVVWMQAIRCPKCRDRWAWRSVSQHSLKSGAHWLAALESCPACGYAPAQAAPPARSAELQSAIDRASAALEASSLDISAAHLLLELLKAESVIELLRGTPANLDQVKRSVEARLPPHTVATSDHRPVRFARDARACFRHATIHALSSGSPEVTSPMLLLAYLSKDSTLVLRRILEDAGLSTYALRVRIAHGPDTDLEPPRVDGPVAVVMHNDPFTTVQFVREMLTQVFGLPAARATELAGEIQSKGSSVIAELQAPAALDRIAELRRRAIAHDFPLRVTLEKQP